MGSKTGPSQPGGSPPRWQQALAVAYLLGVAAAAVAFRDRLGADFWPLDRSSVGPNILASAIVAAFLLIATALLYPPWRRAVHRFVDGKLGAVHAKLDAREAELAALHAKHDDLRAALRALHEAHNELHEAITGRRPKPPPGGSAR